MEKLELKPVFWYEGQFVRPHHFQIQDQYYRDYAYALYGMVTPNCWGVLRLEYSPQLLKNHILELTKCWVLFPDGTYLKYPGNSSLYQKSLVDILPEEGERLSIYLSLSKYGTQEVPGEGLKTSYPVMPVDMKTARYGITRKQQENLYDGTDPEEIATLELQCQILTQDELVQIRECVAVKIMELVRNGNKMVPARDYIPPTSTISGVNCLEALILEVRNDLATKVRNFERCKTKLGHEHNGAGLRFFTMFQAQMALNRAISAIDHLLELDVVGPWMIHGVLRTLYAELSTCDMSGEISGWPAFKKFSYLHDDIFKSLESLSREILAVIDKFGDVEEIVFAMQYDGTYYSTILKDESLSPEKKKILRIKAGDEQAGVIKVLSRTAKVSSREYLPLLIARSLPGVDINDLSIPPVHQPHNHGFYYFSLEQQGTAWEHVVSDGNLALFIDNLPAFLDVALVTVNDT